MHNLSSVRPPRKCVGPRANEECGAHIYSVKVISEIEIEIAKKSKETRVKYSPASIPLVNYYRACMYNI